MRWLANLMLLGVLGDTSITQKPPGTLAPLEFLVGSCWKGTFPDGKKTDEHCFEWVFDRKFIRDRHVVEGGEPYRGESIFGYDATAKKPAFWYWNSDGLVTVGTMEYRGASIVFPERYTGPDGEVVMEAVWTRKGNDAYHVDQRRKKGEGWETLWTMTLTRGRKSAEGSRPSPQHPKPSDSGDS